MPDKISTSTIMKTIALIIAVVASIYGSIQFIDIRIEHAVNDEQFIRRLSSHVRPYVIFDVSSSILVDGGAMQYLEKIEVEETGKKDGTILPIKIVVTPTRHLAYPPLIEKLGAGRLIHTPNPKRGTGHQWIYAGLEVVHWETDKTPISFRLEILK